MGEERLKPEAGTRDRGLGRMRKTGGSRSSSLARKVIFFNLLALTGLIVAVLLFSPNRAAMIAQDEQALREQAALLAQLVAQGSGNDLPLGAGQTLILPDGAKIIGPAPEAAPSFTPISDFLHQFWAEPKASVTPFAELLAQAAPASAHERDATTGLQIAATAPLQGGQLLLIRDGSALTKALHIGQERILHLFAVAAALSVLLSFLLAKTISRPLVNLAAAAEGGEGDRAQARVDIPDLTNRPDEIGRLSVALRGMVTALYERIDSNEQFAADVSHEIKNPLASLRSAVGSLRMVKKDEHRERLLDVIEHDVRRLDRLVSDISNASRLDSELVKEQEEEFDISLTLTNLCDYLSQQAAEKGVEFLTDLPKEVVILKGLEARLAQVFVNLISNAISFCEEGDAVRLWLRRRDQRILIVVEDTGPGIPEQALQKVFNRFYSDRPPSHFGNNSGLGLSISKQIIEAHGGVIWAENIRVKGARADSPPLGARFVVGLPL